ncbi:MAG: hypothetical protein GY953_51885, partial [bacterium]|nr:hypothetical protein [bacterium]
MLALSAWLLAVITVPSGRAQENSWKGKGVLDVTESPHAKLSNVPVSAVTITDGFWSARRKVNEQKSIPTLHQLLEANGIIDNFRRLDGKNVERQGPLYTDSDVYKWMEAAAFVLQYKDDPELRATMEELIGIIVTAQDPNGYLNTYY